MPIIGYQKKIKQLQNFLNRGALFPVILFEGPEHIGKLTIAREFIKGLQCSEKQFGGCGRCENCLGQDHDLMIINESLRLALRQEEPENDPYGIKGAGRIIDFVQTTPLAAPRKIVLIDNAHWLTFGAQNKLLKTLEEPPRRSIFILVSHKPEMLLPTVYSRCLKIPFSLTAKETIKNHPGFSQRRAPLELLAQYSMGRPGCACFWQNNKNAVSQFKSQALAVLKFLQAGFPENLSRLPKADEKAEQEMFNLLELFQIICRDALLYACGVGQPAILLSRDPKIKDIGRMRQALRQSLHLAGILEKAVSPLALTRCFEYLAVKT